MKTTNIELNTKGLKTIYLHNSYIRNRRVKMQCDGHTNLIGANGRGKTSILNLLPIFAGVTPESMVEKAGNKLSFLDYYLPNLQSMIIFEYLNNQGVCCVVIYRHQNGTKLIYRFVQSSAEDSFFALQFNQLFLDKIPTNEIIHELQLNNIKVSKQIETTLDYRAVLHNDKERFSRDKSLRMLAADFALCDRQFTLRHVGELTRVPMYQSDLINKFKSMLVDAFLDDENAVLSDKGLTHTSNLNLIDDMRSLLQFVKSSPQLEKGKQLRNNILQNYQQLVTCNIQGQMLTEDLTNQETELQLNYDNFILKYEHDYENFQDSITNLTTQLHQKKGEYTAIHEHIERINTTELNYLKINIDRMISEYDNLVFYQTKVEEERNHLQRLQAFAKDIVESFDQSIRDIREQTNQEIALWEQKKVTTHGQLSSLFRQRLIEENALRQVQENELANLSDNHQMATESIHVEIQQTYRVVGEAGVYTLEEVNQLEQIKKQLKDQKQDINDHLTLTNKLKSNVELHKKQLQDALEAHDKTKKLFNNENEYEQKLREQLNSDGTLISFLRNDSNDAWKNNIGRLINPALLLKKGLNPKWETDEIGQNSFYGLIVDVDKLCLPDEADTLDDLKKRIEKQNLRCTQVLSELKNLERRLTTANDLLEKAQLELSVSEQEEFNLYRKSNELEAAQERIENEIKMKVQKRKEVADQRLIEVQQQLAMINLQHKTEKNDLLKLHDAARLSIENKYSFKDVQLQEEILQIDQNIKLCNSRRDQKISELHRSKDNALKADGVDVQQLASAEQRLDQVTQQFETVKGYVTEINRYHDWAELELSQRDKLHDHLKNLQEDLKHLEQAHINQVNALKHLDQQKKEHMRNHQETLKLIQNKSQQVENLLKRLEPALLDFNEQKFDLVREDVEMPLDFDWYINQGQNQLLQLTELRKDSLKLHTLVKHILSLAQGNGLEQYWSNQMQDSRYQVDSLPYMLQAMTVLEKMLNHEIPAKIVQQS